MAAVGSLVAVSSLYETEPIGGPEQGDYLNAVIVVATDALPRTILEAGFEAERMAGRQRRRRWGPRTLDVDVLLYGEQVLDEPGLRIPHPRMTRRRFVLEPLVDVWPTVVIPGAGRAADLLEEVAEQEVRQVEGPGWASGSDRDQ